MLWPLSHLSVDYITESTWPSWIFICLSCFHLQYLDSFLFSRVIAFLMSNHITYEKLEFYLDNSPSLFHWKCKTKQLLLRSIILMLIDMITYLNDWERQSQLEFHVLKFYSIMAHLIFFFSCYDLLVFL